MSDLKNVNRSMDKEADLSGTIFTGSIGYSTTQITQPESENKKPQSYEKPKRIKLHPIQISTEKEPVDIKEEDLAAIERLKRVMESNTRTDEEAWMIYEAIKTFKFFEEVLPGKNDQESLLKIMKALKYRKVRAGRPVFVEGEQANENVYILYSGSLSVMSKNTIVEDASQLSPVKSISKSKVLFDYGLETSPTKKTLTHANTLENLPDIIEQASGLVSKRNYNRQRTLKEKQMTRIQSTSKIQSLQSYPKFGPNDEPDSPISIGKEFMNLKDDLNEENSPGMSPIESVKEKRDNESVYGRVRSTIEKGEHFGDQVLEPEAKRSTTVLANVNSELLVLAGSTLNALKNEFSKTMKKIQSFLIERIPGMDFISAKAIMKKHMNLLEETSFSYGNHIINEGDKGDRFYIICEGACEIYRTVKIEEPESLTGNYSKIKNTFFSQTHSIKEKIVLTKLKEGALIGEEILFSDNSCYTYSIQVISDSCKTIALKKELAAKFPKEVLLKLQQGFEDKKNYKDRLLCQSLEKRDVQFVKGAFDTPFFTVKRNVAQDGMSAITKINHVPSQFESYKIMTDNIAQNELNTPTGSSAIYLPKLAKPKHMTFKEPQELHRKQKFLSFSRAHLMPQKDKDTGKRRSPSEQKISEKLPLLIGLSSHENSIVEGESNVDHIRKGKLPVAYNDITDIYHDLSPKLNLKMNNNEAKANLYNADYFKFDFGEPEPVETKRTTRLVRKDKSNTLIGHPSSVSNSPSRKHIHHATMLTQISTGSVTSTNQLNSLLKVLDFDTINANGGTTSPNTKEMESKRVNANDKPQPQPQQQLQQLQPLAWEASGTETLITLQSLTTRPQKFDPSFLRDFAPKPKLKQRDNNPIKSNVVNNTSLTGNNVKANQRQHHLSMKMDYKRRLEGSLEQVSQEQEVSYLAALPETPVRKAFVSLKRGNIPSLKAVQLGPLKLLQEKFEKLRSKEIKRKI